MAYSEASKRATIKYQREHLKRVPLSLKVEEYAQVKAAADSVGESVNGYIKSAVRARLSADGFAADSAADPVQRPAGVPVGES